LARASCAAERGAVRHGYGIDRTGARGADGIEREPVIFKQAIQHTPSKCAVRAAALKRKVDGPAVAA
jgi:hypothetical protein